MGQEPRVGGDQLRIGSRHAFDATGAAIDLIALAKRRHTLADSHDHAGQVAAQDGWQIGCDRRTGPPDLVVDGIDAGRLDADQHFAGARLGIGQLGRLKHVGVAELGDDLRFHSVLLRMRLAGASKMLRRDLFRAGGAYWMSETNS